LDLKGDFVWLEPKLGNEFDVAIGAKVNNSNSNQILVVDDEGKVRIIFKDKYFFYKFNLKKL
jgi:hypothetical protein